MRKEEHCALLIEMQGGSDRPGHQSKRREENSTRIRTRLVALPM